MARLVMLVDTKKCTGCHTCVFACRLENNLPNNIWWNTTITGTPDKPDEKIAMDNPTGRYVSKGGLVMDKSKGIIPLMINYYTKACQHCAKPACLDVCPTKATFVRSDGIVNVDTELCIGCNACIDACPYDVRRYNATDEKYGLNFTVGSRGITHKPDTVDKCNLCSHLIDKGKQPSCVTNCPLNARKIGDLDNPKSEIAQILKERKFKQLRPEAGTKPSVYFLI